MDVLSPSTFGYRNRYSTSLLYLLLAAENAFCLLPRDATPVELVARATTITRVPSAAASSSSSGSRNSSKSKGTGVIIVLVIIGIIAIAIAAFAIWYIFYKRKKSQKNQAAHMALIDPRRASTGVLHKGDWWQPADDTLRPGRPNNGSRPYSHIGTSSSSYNSGQYSDPYKIGAGNGSNSDFGPNMSANNANNRYSNPRPLSHIPPRPHSFAPGGNASYSQGGQGYVYGQTPNVNSLPPPGLSATNSPGPANTTNTNNAANAAIIANAPFRVALTDSPGQGRPSSAGNFSNPGKFGNGGNGANLSQNPSITTSEISSLARFVDTFTPPGSSQAHPQNQRNQYGSPQPPSSTGMHTIANKSQTFTPPPVPPVPLNLPNLPNNNSSNPGTPSNVSNVSNVSNAAKFPFPPPPIPQSSILSHSSGSVYSRQTHQPTQPSSPTTPALAPNSPISPLQPQMTGASTWSSPYEVTAMTKSTSGHPGT